MEGFTYSNIFETKGIEYIIVIFFLLILIPFWIFVNRKVPVKEQFQQALNVLTAGVLRIPHGFLFSKNHTWVSLEKTGYAKFGIDDFLQKIVGETQFVPLKTLGEVVQKGEVLAEINQKGKRLKVLSPISGEIMAVNTHKTNMGLPGSDPYEKGWFYSLKPFNWETETSGLFIADEAGIWIKNELERFKDFLNVSLAHHSGQPSVVAFQEGGELIQNPLSELHPEIWKKFQEEFLE